MAAGQDAANRSAARRGSASWNDDDLEVALETFNRIYRLTDAETAESANNNDTD